MEKIAEQYYSIAYNDLRYAQSSFDNNKEDENTYNWVCVVCAQSCEKFLKYALLCTSNSENVVEYLKSHNLRNLIRELGRHITCSLDEKLYKWVGDMYFDCRYPGENFIKATLEDAEECLKATHELKEFVDTIKINNKEQYKIESLEKLSDITDL